MKHNGSSAAPPLEVRVFIEPEGDFVAIAQVVPFESFYSWHDADPNIAKATVSNWYYLIFSRCRHEMEQYSEADDDTDEPIYRCAACEVVVRHSELTLLNIQ